MLLSRCFIAGYVPVVPGHEVVGEVTEVGSKVQKFKVGVGCMVGSCHSCTNNLEADVKYRFVIDIGNTLKATS